MKTSVILSPKMFETHTQWSPTFNISTNRCRPTLRNRGNDLFLMHWPKTLGCKPATRPVCRSASSVSSSTYRFRLTLTQHRNPMSYRLHRGFLQSVLQLETVFIIIKFISVTSDNLCFFLFTFELHRP